MTATPATITSERTRPDPLSPDAARRTVELLDSVRRVLETYIAGRTATGADAVLIRTACRLLGSTLAAIGRRAES